MPQLQPRNSANRISLGQVTVYVAAGGAEESIGASHGVDGPCECSRTCDEMLHPTPHFVRRLALRARCDQEDRAALPSRSE